MKKILISLMAAVLLLPSISVFAETETPVKTKPRVSVHQQRKAPCPPSYVGEKKTCIYVPNPDYDKAKKTVVKPSRQYPTPRANIPTTNPTAYYWALDFAMDQAARTETGKHAVDTFWNDVDVADQALGKFVGALPEGTRRTYEALWQTAVEDGKGYVDMSKPLFDTVFGNAFETIATTASDEAAVTAGESVLNNTKYDDIAKNAMERLGMISITDSFSGTHENYSGRFFGFSGIKEITGSKTKYKFAYYWFVNGSGHDGGESWTYDTPEQAWAIVQDRNVMLNWQSVKKNLVPGTERELGEKITAVKDSVLSNSPSAITLPSGDIRIYLGSEVGHGTTSTVTKDDETGETYVEKVIEVPEIEPRWLPTGGVGTVVPVLVPEKPTKDVDQIKYIPKEVVVDPNGKVVNKDGTVTKEPVVELEDTTKPKPDAVVPPGLPPKDTKAPTGEDLPTKDAEEEGNRWKALVTNKFPFSLPWDVYGILKVLTVDPERPEIDINTETKMAGVSVPIKMKHDFAWMDEIIPFVRTLILISFIIFLIMKTRTLMGGAQ